MATLSGRAGRQARRPVANADRKIADGSRAVTNDFDRMIADALLKESDRTQARSNKLDESRARLRRLWRIETDKMLGATGSYLSLF